MKMAASKTALMCFSQPEFSSPSRKSDMEGECSSHTETTTQLHHRQTAWGIRPDQTWLNFTFSFTLQQTSITINAHGIWVWHRKIWVRLASCVYLQLLKYWVHLDSGQCFRFTYALAMTHWTATVFSGDISISLIKKNLITHLSYQQFQVFKNNFAKHQKHNLATQLDFRSEILHLHFDKH